METKTDHNKTRDQDKIPSSPDREGPSSGTSRTTPVEKTGTAHLTGRISELSIFGLLWG